MQKISTVRMSGSKIFKGQLTIGLDLGDRSSSYCVLDEAGALVLERKLPTTPEAMKETFAGMPQSRIAMETCSESLKREGQPRRSPLRCEYDLRCCRIASERRNSPSHSARSA